MMLIRSLSENIDKICLNFIRYQQCRLRYFHDERTPDVAGHLSSNYDFASALIININEKNGILLTGMPFNSHLNKSTGLAIKQPELNDIPRRGGVGDIINHALFLYSQILLTQSATSRYVHVLSLLEYLAYPFEYRKFKIVKQRISKYISNDIKVREKIHERFKVLTGKKDKSTNEELGIRTNIVHYGKRFEDVVTELSERKNIFIELDTYIRAIIDHMIDYDDLEYDEYDNIVDTI